MGHVARLLACLLVGSLAWTVQAAEGPRPFVVGSLKEIQAAHAGKPLIVAFWSVGCTHCPAELKTLGALKRRHPGLNIVLVAADTPEDGPETRRLAAQYGLDKAPQWVFADPIPERLRMDIDRRWYGELPRTHFYDAEHRLEAVSGVVPEARLRQWVATNLR